MDASNWRQALRVRTTPAQLKYVADYEPVALVILAKCQVRAGGVNWHPLAITKDNTIVGVVAITHQANRCEIFHLVIDRQHQGQGLGKAAVLRVVEYISAAWPTVETITLTVHPENQVATMVYLACGFVATGELRDAEPVMKLSI